MAGGEGGIYEVIQAINNIGTKLDVHIARMDETSRKTEKVYQTVITGNGVPSLVEDVRKLKERNANADWIIKIIGGAVLVDLVMKLWQMLK